MFKITQNPTFEAAVGLSVPGLPETVQVFITYRNKTKTAFVAWINTLPGRDHVVYLDEIIESWRGISDDAGMDVPYSLSALTDLLDNHVTASAELLSAYTRELTEAKRKNS